MKIRIISNLLNTFLHCLGYKFMGLNRGTHEGKEGIWYREWAPGAKVCIYTFTVRKVCIYTFAVCIHLKFLNIFGGITQLGGQPIIGSLFCSSGIGINM